MRRMRWTAALVGAAIVVAGCSADGDFDSASPTSGGADEESLDSDDGDEAAADAPTCR